MEKGGRGLPDAEEQAKRAAMGILGARQDQQKGLSGWGRVYLPGVEERSEDLRDASARYALSRGLGRSYGDASVPTVKDGRALGTSLADRILSFDEQTGILSAEAGLCLAEMNRLYLHRGWFTPVTPGTKFVTLGGMVASDVHGKNHHVSGTIGRHVTSLLLRTGGGQIVRASREENTDLFFATLGGMGLTGHILEVSLKLEKIPSPWIYTESYRISDLSELLTRIREAGREWPMTVAWVDTVARGRSMGRGILFVGRWAEPGEAPPGLPRNRPSITMPFSLPSGLLNRFTLRVFNQLLYASHLPKTKRGFVGPDKFFYPLDSIHHWNRLYGSRGVTQHQSVIPYEAGAAGITRMMDELARFGTASFLSVVKDCGPEGEGLLSFPKPGMSLALDLPVRRDSPEIISRLNGIVHEYDGRIYLTKDGLSTSEQFAQMEPRLPAFQAVREKWDPEKKLKSAQSQRLFGDT